jgi:hypothetical protein
MSGYAAYWPDGMLPRPEAPLPREFGDEPLEEPVVERGLLRCWFADDEPVVERWLPWGELRVDEPLVDELVIERETVPLTLTPGLERRCTTVIGGIAARMPCFRMNSAAPRV